MVVAKWKNSFVEGITFGASFGFRKLVRVYSANR